MEENHKQEAEQTPEQLPEYTFRAVDGTLYHIGPTPRSFEDQLFKVLDKLGTVGSADPSIREFIELWDDWLYEHLRWVPGQEKVTREVITHLYHVQDRPAIIAMIMARYEEATDATAQAMDVMADAGKTLAMSYRYKREQMNGDRQPERPQAVLDVNQNNS